MKRNKLNVAWTEKMNAAGWFPCGAFDPEWCEDSGVEPWENENSGRRIGCEQMTDLYWQRQIPAAEGENEPDDEHAIMQVGVADAVTIAKKEQGSIAFAGWIFAFFEGVCKHEDPVTGRGPRFSESEVVGRLHLFAIDHPGCAQVCWLDSETKIFEDAEIIPD